MNAQRARLPDGRWHFQHGPIDIVIGAEGEARAVAAAHQAAWQRMQTVLGELVAELPALRRAICAPLPLAPSALYPGERAGVRGTGAANPLHGAIARRMWSACAPYAAQFITPMAAVAGAVAQELIAAYERKGIQRAWANNGGDIALHLAAGASVRVGLFADLARFDPSDGAVHTDGHFDVLAADPVRGIATSGWRGRSFSLGIADSVTVLARTAAQADAAATVIANAVDADDPRIERRPANQIKDDSDLGDVRVTVDVPPLGADVVRRALRSGERCARELQRAGLIVAAVLVCQRQALRVEGPALTAPATSRPELGSVFA